jgi:hypothetical protein
LQDRLDDAGFLDRIRANAALLRELAAQILQRASDVVPGIESAELANSLPPPAREQLLFA